MTATAGLARRLFKVANDSLTADLELRRAVFVKTMLELPHWTAGSGPRQQMREMCAAELHHRAGMFTTAITTAHRALHATPSSALLQASKHWVVVRITHEASTEFDAFLWRPRPAFDETGEPDNLNEAAEREVPLASAALDAYWSELENNRIERFWRWVVRVSSWIVTASLGLFTGAR
jgi:hypothetical protein